MENNASRVLAISNDLFFMPQIAAQAKAAGLQFEWLDTAVSEADFMSRLAAAPTALVVLDLATTLPWQPWLAAARADASTASIRWLAFGPHTDAPRLAAARKAGVDKVAARSKFAAELNKMLAGSHVASERSQAA